MNFKDTFNDRVYGILKTVPAGYVTTYKDIAKALGCRAYRAVGNALRLNRNAPEIPCHRVVNSDGSIGGYSAGGGRVKKKKLLQDEGVAFKGWKILNFEEFIYEVSEDD